MFVQNNFKFLLFSIFITPKLIDANVLINSYNTEQLNQTNGTFGQSCQSQENCSKDIGLFCFKKKCQCAPIADKWDFDLLKCVDVNYCKNDSECININEFVYEHKICNLTKGINFDDYSFSNT